MDWFWWIIIAWGYLLVGSLFTLFLLFIIPNNDTLRSRSDFIPSSRVEIVLCSLFWVIYIFPLPFLLIFDNIPHLMKEKDDKNGD
jgi:ABC-type multidrug transport system permease subunit